MKPDPKDHKFNTDTHTVIDMEVRLMKTETIEKMELTISDLEAKLKEAEETLLLQGGQLKDMESGETFKRMETTKYIALKNWNEKADECIALKDENKILLAKLKPLEELRSELLTTLKYALTASSRMATKDHIRQALALLNETKEK